MPIMCDRERKHRARIKRAGLASPKGTAIESPLRHSLLPRRPGAATEIVLGTRPVQAFRRILD
ncbi:hypothetical protein GCM10011574_04080 [Microbispora bryophytorum]|uniref:Uncharacterized protein n=1 Tax=Microbispora bryophytorum TaxID=1460882 RepID=A0A8H9GTK0_9ACTN|nr:hypothetical protein GCM10011574_04080 [Microbispora bryophytorum]